MESDQQFIERVQDKDPALFSQEERTRYYNMDIQYDENFSNRAYQSFIYNPNALIPISGFVRRLLASNSFTSLATGATEVEKSYFISAWGFLEGTVINLRYENEEPELGYTSPEAFRSALIWLNEQGLISTVTLHNIVSAREEYEAIEAAEGNMVSTDKTKKYVDFIISIHNQIANTSGRKG